MAITLVDVVVFLPIAFLSGIVGKFMVEFGVVVVVATLFSLLVSFTLTPMLAARWSVKRRSVEPPRYLAWFQIGFDRLNALVPRRRVRATSMRHRWLTVSLCALLLLNALTLVASAFPVAARHRRGRDRGRAAVAAVLAAAVRAHPPGHAGGRHALQARRALRRRRRPGPRAAGRRGAGGRREAAGVVAAAGGAILVLALVATAVGHLVIDKPAVSGRASVGASGAIALLGGVMGLLMLTHSGIESEFIPSSDTGSIRMTLTYPTGTPLAKTQAGDRPAGSRDPQGRRGREEHHHQRRQAVGLRLDHRRQRRPHVRRDGQEAPQGDEPRDPRDPQARATSPRAPCSTSPARAAAGAAATRSSTPSRGPRT